MEERNLKIVMMGATGAVGSETLNQLLKINAIKARDLLDRNKGEGIDEDYLKQHFVDIFKPESYKQIITDHSIAIPTIY